MGKRSPSPRRRRSRSRERRRSRSRERRDDKKDRKRDEKEKKPEKKSTAQGILEAKKLMRESLKSAASSISYDVPTGSNDSTETESGGSGGMSRARTIAEIDDDGFKQRSFKSTGGGAGGRVYSHKDDRKKTEKMEELHDSIIFGPTSRPILNQKEEEIDEIAQLLKEEPREIFPAVCYEDRESREARWLALYNERRNRVLS